jgi:hypothetical protein
MQIPRFRGTLCISLVSLVFFLLALLADVLAPTLSAPAVFTPLKVDVGFIEGEKIPRVL